MPAFTTNQWVILFLVLLLGWLLGLVSRSGGKKWRLLYESERDARAEEQAEHQAAIAAADERIAELEKRLPAVTPAPATAATAQTLDLTRDDLSAIRGIGKSGERRLNAEGIYRYRDITALTPEQESLLETKLGADQGYIEQEQWRQQAALLEEGKVEEHRASYG